MEAAQWQRDPTIGLVRSSRARIQRWEPRRRPCSARAKLEPNAYEESKQKRARGHRPGSVRMCANAIASRGSNRREGVRRAGSIGSRLHNVSDTGKIEAEYCRSGRRSIAV